ncbi:MAG: prepilin-type N-terminal cleavage/methylation domain-containing protein [Planctomycetes bacterium]|nr:prepilin-type N-terminal cleavage/methylation domain-containing protein [Planctomycetota bacterium]
MTVSRNRGRRGSLPARSLGSIGAAQRAFTLIELLVAIGLATILVGTVAVIFHGSTDIFKTSESRIAIYGNARAAMDVLARDISSMLPRDGGQQRLVITNRCLPPHLENATAPGTIVSHQGGNRADPALDVIQFRAIIPINSTGPPANTTLPSPTLTTVHVMYGLRPDDDPEILSTTASTTTTSGRNLYVLRKRVYNPTLIGGAGTQDPNGANIDARPPAAPYAASAYIDESGDLCHFVLSFNIEWIHNNQAATVAGAPPAGCWQLGSLGTLAAPIGAAATVAPNLMPQALRFTLRVAEGASVRQERVITRVVWVPLS